MPSLRTLVAPWMGDDPTVRGVTIHDVRCDPSLSDMDRDAAVTTSRRQQAPQHPPRPLVRCVVATLLSGTAPPVGHALMLHAPGAWSQARAARLEARSHHNGRKDQGDDEEEHGNAHPPPPGRSAGATAGGAPSSTAAAVSALAPAGIWATISATLAGL